MDILVPVEQIPAFISLDGTELIPATRGGLIKPVTPALIKSYINSTATQSQIFIAKNRSSDGQYHRFEVTIDSNGNFNSLDLGF